MTKLFIEAQETESRKTFICANDICLIREADNYCQVILNNGKELAVMMPLNELRGKMTITIKGQQLSTWL